MVLKEVMPLAIRYVMLQASLQQILFMVNDPNPKVTNKELAELQGVRAQIEAELKEIREPMLLTYLDIIRQKSEYIQGGAVF